MTPFGVVTWLPEALTWSKAQKGSKTAAERFLFTTKYWGQIMGWITFPVTLFLAAMAIDPYLLEDDYDDYDDDSNGIYYLM